MAEYFVKQTNGKIVGPFSGKKLKTLAIQGDLQAFDEISNSKGGPWQAAGAVKGIAGILTTPTGRTPRETGHVDDQVNDLPANVPPAEQPASTPSTDSAKTIACEDCGGTVSRRATACPHCGCPIGEDQYSEDEAGVFEFEDDEYALLNADADDGYQPMATAQSQSPLSRHSSGGSVTPAKRRRIPLWGWILLTVFVFLPAVGVTFVLGLIPSAMFQTQLAKEGDILFQRDNFHHPEQYEALKALDVQAVVELDDQGEVVQLGFKDRVKNVEKGEFFQANDDTLVVIQDLSQLRRLDLTSSAVTDDGLVSLQGLAHLEELKLGDVQFKGHGLKHLGRLAHLKQLSLDSPFLETSSLQYLAQWPKLEELILPSIFTRQDESPARQIAQLSAMKSLTITCGFSSSTPPCRGTDLVLLGGLVNLERLELSAPGSHGLWDDQEEFYDENGGKVTSAYWSEAKNENITDDDLVPLSRCTKLKELSLHGISTIKGDGLRHLAGLADLRTLDLSHTAAGDEWCTSLAVAGIPQNQHGGFVNTVGMRFRRVPAGKFTQGIAPGYFSWPTSVVVAHPQRTVTVGKPFYFGQVEVTQGQYEAVMGQAEPTPTGPPAVNVTWHNAVQFCEKLSADPFEKAAGNEYRLPTSSEWEYVCRAGSQGPYCFHVQRTQDLTANTFLNTLHDFAWFQSATSASRMAAYRVGQKKPNPWGFYDMHGNVLEWCSDWQGPPPQAKPETDPSGPMSGTKKVLRGGGFSSPPAQLISGLVFGAPPNSSSPVTGFRVVCTRRGAQRKVGGTELKWLASVETLRLKGTGMTNKAFPGLTKFRNLRELDLSETKVGGGGRNFQLLTAHEQLEVLLLSNTLTSDLDLSHLAGKLNLSKLELKGCQITKGGVSYLKSMKTLKLLDVRETKIPETAIADLQKALPNCEILR